MEYTQHLLKQDKINFNVEVKKNKEFKDLKAWIDKKAKVNIFNSPFMLYLAYYLLYLEYNNIFIGVVANGYALSYANILSLSGITAQKVIDNPSEIIFKEQLFPRELKLTELYKFAILDALNESYKQKYL